MMSSEKTDINPDFQLTESLEDYLETILDLETINKVARAKDIAVRMGVKSGSVTGALKALSSKGLINYKPYSYVTLTSDGKQIALKIRNRHNVIKDFLQNILNVEEKTADETACRMEHVIDKDTMYKLTSFIEFINNCPKAGSDWIQSYLQYDKNKRTGLSQCDFCDEECDVRSMSKKREEISD